MPVLPEESSQVDATDCIYLSLDEGGNFDFTSNGTRYFTRTGVVTKRPFGFENDLSALKHSLLESGQDFEYFHASENAYPIRHRVFEVIAAVADSLQAYTTIVDKRTVGPSFQSGERLYPYVYGHLMRRVWGDLGEDDTSLFVVITDRLPVKRKRRQVEKAIKTTIARSAGSRRRYLLYHHESRSHLGLQVADYINWAIHRKWTRDDERSYQLVRQAIKIEEKHCPG